MASWRDKLRKASFRGVEFEVPDDTSEGGRRLAVHEFPQKDIPYAEDLGLKARKYQVEAYVIGADFQARRDALIKALEEKGPGALVHPHYGETKVAVESMRIVHTNREGGMARFSISFIAAGENRYPTQIADTRSAVKSRAVLGRARTIENFARRLQLGGFPGFVRTDAQQTLTGMLGQIEGQARQLTGAGDEAAGMARDVTSFRNMLPTMLANPFGVASSYSNLLSALKGLAPTRPRAVYGSYLNLASLGLGSTQIPATTPSRLAVAENQAAIADLTHQLALVEAAQMSSTIDFDSRQQAFEVRDDLALRLDEAMAEAPDDVFRSLADLRVAVINDIGARASGYPALVSYTPAATHPALAIANRLYGDAGVADELIGRNRIRHPGFVPGGVPMEVPAYG